MWEYGCVREATMEDPTTWVASGEKGESQRLGEFGKEALMAVLAGGLSDRIYEYMCECWSTIHHP